jgi:hypothetical protein
MYLKFSPLGEVTSMPTRMPMVQYSSSLSGGGDVREVHAWLCDRREVCALSIP